MEINGIAHTFLTSGDFPAARRFYSQLLPYLGLTPVLDTDDTYYCVGGRTALGIRASARQEPVEGARVASVLGQGDRLTLTCNVVDDGNDDGASAG